MNLSIYEQNDYRHFIFAHFQYLQKLCQHSIQIQHDSIKYFLNSLLITPELISEDNFHSRLSSSIEQTKQDIPNNFGSLFFLIRSINHANAFVTTYGTNYQYTSTWFTNGAYYPYLSNRAIIYDDQCSCGLQSNCTTQAYFYLENSTKIFLKGLKIGCTPSESLHVSTLECLYDRSCLDLIQQYVNLTIDPLSINTSQFYVNTSVFELIENLFVEEWISSINYSLYYYQCLPRSCSYTYIQQFNILYLITLLLGLQGGLTIVLIWICPKIVRILVKINEKRKKRLNIVQPEPTTDTTTVSNELRTNINVTNASSVKLILICFFVILIITGLTLFSVYIARSNTYDDQFISKTNSICILNYYISYS